MPKMRAMIVPERGGRFRLEERDLPQPGKHEVRIRVHACGVCHSDSVTVEGLMPGITYPRIPGHEVIGVIDALGADVEGWDVGARVGVGWFGGSCGYCAHCRRNEAFACENIHGATGVSRDGGYATHMLALASALAHVPAALDSVEFRTAPLRWHHDVQRSSEFRREARRSGGHPRGGRPRPPRHTIRRPAGIPHRGGQSGTRQGNPGALARGA